MSEEPQHSSEENMERPRDVGMLELFLYNTWENTHWWRRKEIGPFRKWISLVCWYKLKMDCRWSPTYCVTQTLLSWQRLEQPLEGQPHDMTCCFQGATHTLCQWSLYVALSPRGRIYESGSHRCNWKESTHLTPRDPLVSWEIFASGEPD